MKTILQITLLISLMLFASILSCTNQDQHIAFANDGKDFTENLIILESNKLYKSDTIVYPIGIQELSENKKQFYEDAYYSRRGETRYSFVRNLMFYDLRTGSNQWMLKSDKAIISKMDPFMYSGVLRKDDTIGSALDYLLFEIIEEDFNNDEVLNNQDTKVLYRTNLFGGELTPLTPPNFNVTKWKYLDYTENKIEVYGQYDSNNDLVYRKMDDYNTVFIIDLDKPEEKVDVFPASLREAISLQ